MGRVPSRGSDQFVVRFPDGVRDKIRQAAEASGRSMNAEIVARLSDSFAFSVRITALSRERDYLEGEVKRLQQEAEKLQAANESLTKVITNAAAEFDGVEGLDRVQVLTNALANEIEHRRNQGQDPTLARENAALRTQIEKMEKEQPIINIVLDANGLPISWPEIVAHMQRTANAAGIEAASIRGAIINLSREASTQGTDEDDRFDEYARLIRWYLKETRKIRKQSRDQEG